MEAIWERILEVLSLFLIPDWGDLIGLLPLGVAGLVVLWTAWTVQRFATAGPTRRAPARVTPVTPATIHMPGASAAPILGALGTALLLAGLVFGGVWLWLGPVALVLALLYWGRQGLRDYEHVAGSTEVLPAIRREAPPGVHVPGPSFRPLLGALATAGLVAGLVFGAWVLAIGVLFLAVALLGWLSDAKAEYRKVEAAAVTGHLENIPAPGWPRIVVPTFALLFLLAGLLQAGVFSPGSESGGGAGQPSAGVSAGPAGGASTEPSLAPGTLVVTAKGIAFLEKTLEIQGGTAFAIHFANDDPSGVFHDVDIRTADGAVLADQTTIDGGTSADYAYEPLDAGEYVFICSIHPIPAMTGTLSVK